MEQPGVKAPGTANMSTLPAEHRVPVLTALAGVSSNKFTEGSASPIWNMNNFLDSFSLVIKLYINAIGLHEINKEIC